MVGSIRDSSLRSRLLARISSSPNEVWVLGDFADLGNRSAIDKTLQRLVNRGNLRRIDRGLYDCPQMGKLTAYPAVADYRAVICAITLRDQVRT